jgi:hypothetical protein
VNVWYSFLHSNDKYTSENVHFLAIKICKAEYFQACELTKFSQPADYMEEMLGNVAMRSKIAIFCQYNALIISPVR